MKKYILEYTDYDEVITLLGHDIPHEHLEHVITVIVDLHDEEYLAIKEAGYTIRENGTCEILSWPAAMPYRSLNPTPPYISTYLKIKENKLAGFDGTGVKVALLDSGCQDSNLALCSPTTTRVDIGYGVVDSYNHGSKACMVISQRYSFFSAADVKYGMAYGCNLYSLRVIDGGEAGVITGINWAIANGIHIINISLSIFGVLNTAINAAIAAGIIVVCSSGNSLFQYIAHPADVQGVIAISAVDNTQAGPPLFGAYLTLDGHIGVTLVSYAGGYYEFFTGGTSQAAFQLTSLLAIYKQKYPSLDTPKAIRLLQRKAIHMDGYTYTVPSTTKNTLLNYETGAGFLSPIY